MAIISIKPHITTDVASILEQSTIHKAFQHSIQDPFSDQARVILQWVCYSVLGQILAIFGSVTNIINIICFVKQGFKDPVNISLLCLSISDLFSLLTITWTNICYNPALSELDLSFEPIEIQLLIGTWPHLTFTHVTSWITAFITLERCLCVTMPLKVKRIITPKRVTIIIVIIYLVLIAAVAPIYFVTSYGLKFSPFRNKTILGLIYTADRHNVEQATHALNNVIIPFGAFVTVIVCTVALVLSLKVKTAWRKKSIIAGQSDNLSNRDQKVARMMVMISTIFIACFFPVSVFVVAIITVPQLSLDGSFANLLISLGGVAFILESTNSAINIFIYYHMSSRYRAVFRQLMPCSRAVSTSKVLDINN